MLGHRLEETSTQGWSINPNSCLLGVGGGQSPFFPSEILFPSLPSSRNPRGGTQAVRMLKAES